MPVCLVVFRKKRKNAVRRSVARQKRSARSLRERGKTERPRRQHRGTKETKSGPFK